MGAGGFFPHTWLYDLFFFLHNPQACELIPLVVEMTVNPMRFPNFFFPMILFHLPLSKVRMVIVGRFADRSSCPWNSRPLQDAKQDGSVRGCIRTQDGSHSG